MQLRVLTGEEVRSAIDMKQAIAAMREAFGQLSAGRARVPVRLRLESRGVTLFMPAYLEKTGDLGAKIVSLFADNPLYNGLDPHQMVRLAEESECDGWLIDTLTKDGRNLFDFLAEEELREMVFAGKELGQSTALSGHLRIERTVAV